MADRGGPDSGGVLRAWFLLPRDPSAADTLRWVRRIEVTTLATSVALLPLFLLTHDSIWWVWLVPSGICLVGLATIGPSIRRAEARAPAATRPPLAARRRRAIRITLMTHLPLLVVATVVLWVTADPVTALGAAALYLVAGGAGFWIGLRNLRP